MHPFVHLFTASLRFITHTPPFTGHEAISQIFRVIEEQSQPTFDENFDFISYYNWTGGNGALSPAVPNAGNGEPKAYTGLVGTHHRPSDDLSTFGTSHSVLVVPMNVCTDRRAA